MTEARVEQVPADAVTARARRVEASYHAQPAANASVDDAAEATRELYARTEELLHG